MSRSDNASEYLDKRIEVDRRRFSYTAYIPERRTGTERRNCQNHKNPIAKDRKIKLDNLKYN